MGGPQVFPGQGYLHRPLSALAHCTPCPQLVLLSEEKQGLAQENAVLRQRMGQPEGEVTMGLTTKKLLLLQSQLEQLQEENFRCGLLGLGPGRQGVGVGVVPSCVYSHAPPGWRTAGRMIICDAWS